MESFIEAVVKACPSIDSIWLIGSRANGNARATSDWDYLVFGSLDIYNHLQAALELHLSNVDFLVVINGNDFKNAWGEKDKEGSLSEWEWTAISESKARYTESKWVEEQSKVVLNLRDAALAWRRKL